VHLVAAAQDQKGVADQEDYGEHDLLHVAHCVLVDVVLCGVGRDHSHGYVGLGLLVECLPQSVFPLHFRARDESQRIRGAGVFGRVQHVHKLGGSRGLQVVYIAAEGHGGGSGVAEDAGGVDLDSGGIGVCACVDCRQQACIVQASVEVDARRFAPLIERSRGFHAV